MTGHAATKPDAERDRRLVTRVSVESDRYTTALAGVTAEAVRTGPGIGPNVVLAVPDESVTVASVRYGFPVVTASAQIPENGVFACYVHESPNESRWCGVPLRPGSVLVYPPGTEHVAVARERLHLTYAVVDHERLLECADRLGVETELPRRSHLFEIPRSAATTRLGTAMGRLTGAAVDGERLGLDREWVVTALAETLAGDIPVTEHGPGQGIDSLEIVHSCIDYAEAADRLPSVSELCAVAHVSHRRLRSAFNDEFDCPPSVYFRKWALERAHRRLRDAGPRERSVTDVALALGFDHLGRFAGSYRSVYGEAPSATLQAVG